MAKLISSPNNILVTLSTLLILIVPNAYPSNDPVITQYDCSLICRGPQRSSKIQLYAHLIYTGTDQSVYEVANSSISDTSPTGFGIIQVFDLKYTRGPDYNSQQVARAQGVAINAGLKVLALELYLNLDFTSGEFNGSTITALGRYEQAAAYRELPVVGGTGTFRCARGHVIFSTFCKDVETNDSVLFAEICVDYVCGV